MTITHRTCKIRLYPTPEQEAALRQRMGASRFCYNWCLNKWGELYKSGEKPSAFSIAKHFRANKPEWFSEMDSRITDLTTANLGNAFKNFFAKRAKYPKFKKKSGNDTYQTTPDRCKVTGTLLKLPKMPEIVMARDLFYTGKMVGAITISCQAGRWYASIPIETEVEEKPITENAIGVDVGITHFATLSDGSKIDNPKHYRATERRLAIRQRRLQRKEAGSKSREDAKFRVQRTHAKIANQRKGFIHRATAELTRKYNLVCIEDLNVAGMLKNRRLSKSISDASFSEFRRQLEYKGNVSAIDRFYPSSKTCHVCETKVDSLPLSVREWMCTSCGAELDRDVNAAMNILREGLKLVRENV